MSHLNAANVAGVQGSGGAGHTLQHVIAPWTVGSQRLWVGVTTLEPGVTTAMSSLDGIESAHFTIEGHGREIVDGTTIETSPGSFVFIPVGAPHQVINAGDGRLRLLTIATPPIGRPTE